jgi:outer membrane protein assembly factor BamA
VNLRNTHIVALITAMFAYAATGCNTYKHVPQGDYLYKGARWAVDSFPLDKTVKSDLRKITRPKPNSRILGIPFKLHLYNLLPEPKKQKGLLHKMKTQWAEAPVLLSRVRASQMDHNLENKLFDYGYFHAAVTHTTDTSGREASIRYRILAGSRYRIRNVYYPQDSSGVSRRIRESATGSLVKQGDFLNLEVLGKERERIAEALKVRGYYFFIPDDILFRTDTLHSGLADIYFTVKDEVPQRALEVWNIGKISIYGNYTLEKDSIITRQKGKREKQFTLVDNRERYKPRVYESALLMKEGQRYNKNLHSLSIERMMNLNTFRFVKFVFIPDTSGPRKLLNTRVYVTPQKKRTVRLEATAETKTGNFVGSELNLKWRNVNLFRGAEILDLRFGGGFDIQVGGNSSSSANAYGLQADASLAIPRIVPYFRVVTGRNSFIPRTVINLGAEFLQRPDLYTQRTFRTSLEYIWKVRKTVEHSVKPIRFQSIDPSNTTPKFDSLLAEDVALRAAFERQIILGSQYQFQFNNTAFDKKRFTHAIRFNVGTSGNLFSLLSNPAVDTPGAKKMFNIPVSQFVKLEADMRGYLRLSPRWTWANRMIAGAAFAYGNSRVVPYAEQFFTGGSMSIRAFRIRTLGPGSYHTDEKVFNANESGDIKFELNSEFRYIMGKYFRLAGFVDAGNIWYRNEPPDKPGSGLDKGDLFREMAVGAGLGLRLDFSILILRLDLATPLRKPWYPEGQRWVINEIDFGSKDWRKENLILNIAIGYPF